MPFLRRNHLLAAGLLFLVAAFLYGSGFRTGAIVLSAFGALIEMVAWAALLTDRSEGEFPRGKR